MQVRNCASGAGCEGTRDLEAFRDAAWTTVHRLLCDWLRLHRRRQGPEVLDSWTIDGSRFRGDATCGQSENARARAHVRFGNVGNFANSPIRIYGALDPRTPGARRWINSGVRGVDNLHRGRSNFRNCGLYSADLEMVIVEFEIWIADSDVWIQDLDSG